MMIHHAEKVARITDSRAVETGKFYTIEVDYVTAGGIKKTLVMPHCLADQLRASIIGEIEMMPEDHRKRSFFASFRRKR